MNRLEVLLGCYLPLSVTDRIAPPESRYRCFANSIKRDESRVSPVTLKRQSLCRETAWIRFGSKHPLLSFTSGVSPTAPQDVPDYASLRIANSSTKNTRTFTSLVVATGPPFSLRPCPERFLYFAPSLPSVRHQYSQPKMTRSGT